MGYYNVSNQKEADGYTWYEIDKNRWCANIDVTYLPKEADDIIRQIETYINSVKEQVNVLNDENRELKQNMKDINDVTRRWI